MTAQQTAATVVRVGSPSWWADCDGQGIAVKRVSEGAWLVHFPDEPKDFAVHEYRIQGERYSRAAHRKVDLNVHLFTCRHPDCQDRPMSAPECVHIAAVKESTR